MQPSLNIFYLPEFSVMNSVPSAAEYRIPNHRVSVVDKGGAGGAGCAGSVGGDRAPPEFCDTKKTTDIEIDRQYVTTNRPEFEKISTALRVDIPESSSRC